MAVKPTELAFQDYYPDEYSHCYGCGRLNEMGLKIKSYWDGDETIAIFQPEPQHTSVPGFVYGGLLASLIDCHCIGSAAAATYRHEGRPMGSEPRLRFVTASLKIDYLNPTPMGVPLEIRGKIREVGKKKVIIDAVVSANGQACVRGEAIAVRLPDTMKKPG